MTATAADHKKAVVYHSELGKRCFAKGTRTWRNVMVMRRIHTGRRHPASIKICCRQNLLARGPRCLNNLPLQRKIRRKFATNKP